MKKKHLIIIPIILAILAGSAFAFMSYHKYWKEAVPVAVDFSSIEKTKPQSLPESQQGALPGESPETAAGLAEAPSELNLKMTFYAQAPFGNWDYPWQEACEEASILLVANTYFDYQWTREQFNDQILKMVDWENKYFGDYKHTDVDETVVMLKKYLKLDSVVHENPTFEDVQKTLAKGHIIVMTFAGKHLGNPFFKNGGPIYHAMVIKGYKAGEKIITEDVGTRNGEDYVYSWETIDNALHDYYQPIENGAKRMIEVLPPTQP